MGFALLASGCCNGNEVHSDEPHGRIEEHQALGHGARPGGDQDPDWVIDLGPERKNVEGQLVTSGTREDVAKVEESWTGQYLNGVLVRATETSRAR